MELVAAWKGIECLRHQREGTAGTLVLGLDERESGGREYVESSTTKSITSGDTAIVDLYHWLSDLWRLRKYKTNNNRSVQVMK